MNSENRTAETQDTEHRPKPTGSQVQQDPLSEWRKSVGIESEKYLVKSQVLSCLESEAGQLGRDAIVAMNDSHFVIAVGRMTLAICKLSLETHKVINLLSHMGKTADGAKISYISLSNCFNQNYLVVMTSNLQLLIFFLRTVDEDDQLIRFPLRICNKSDPVWMQWKENVLFFAIDNEVHTLTFQELPNVELSMISNEVLAECCDYKKAIETAERIEHFDVSRVHNLFYIHIKNQVYIYDEENRTKFTYKVGTKDEKIVFLRAVGKMPEGGLSSGLKEAQLRDYILTVTDKHKMYIHDVSKMTGNNTEESFKVAAFDMHRFKLREDLKIDIDDVLLSADSFHATVVSKALRIGLCFSVDDYYMVGDLVNASKDNAVFPFFDSFFPLSLPKEYLSSRLLAGDVFLKAMGTPELDNPGQLLLTLSIPEPNKLAIHAVPLNALHSLDNLLDEPLNETVDVPKKGSLPHKDSAEVGLPSNLTELHAPFNQITEDANQSPTDPTTQPNKMAGFLDLAEVERQMMEKAMDSKPEHKKSFKEKLIQKKEEAKQNKPQEEPAKPKTKKLKQEPEQLVKSLSELFVGFHEQLAKKVTKIVEDGKKGTAKELQAALLTSAKELKKSYNDEVLKSNEKVLIPYFEKCVFKIFEKYSASLEKTFNTYCEKLESEATNNKNMGGNLDAVFATHLGTATKIQQALDLFMANVDKIVNNAEKPDNERLITILETIANNQSVMNNNLNDLTLRIENIERGMQHMLNQQSEVVRVYKQMYETKTPNFNTPINPNFSFAREAQPQKRGSEFPNPIDLAMAEKYALSQQGRSFEGQHMESPMGESLSRAEVSEKGERKESDVKKKSFAPVFMNPFGISMMYSDKGQPRQL